MNSVQYDKDFAHAMALKLRLNREARVASKAGAASPASNAPSVRDVGPGFRESIAQQVVDENPGLTVEKVLKQMEADGF